MEVGLFYFFSTVALLAGLGVAFAPSMVYAALCLLSVFFSIAGLFVLNNADFLAVAQVMVYAVGLTIVMLFGIMFTGNQPFAALAGRFNWLYTVGSLVAGGSVIGLLAFGVQHFNPKLMAMPQATAQLLQTEGTTLQLGQLLFTKYLLPFEVVSVLLLLAMVGAILLSRKTFAAMSDGLLFSLKDGELVPEASVAWREDVGLPPETTTRIKDANSNESTLVGGTV
jgi:NADH:ubiquinone oxidoreductase subunit 6 (subunit J)